MPSPPFSLEPAAVRGTLPDNVQVLLDQLHELHPRRLAGPEHPEHRRSWTCSLRADSSATRAISERPTMFFRGMYAT